MRNVAVVAASFFLVLVVEFFLFDASFELYYFSLLLTSVAVIAICGKFYTPQLALYAVLQFFQGCFYLAILGGLYNSVHELLWEYPVNFSLILMAYEIAIIAYGALNVSSVHNGMRSAGNFGHNFI